MEKLHGVQKSQGGPLLWRAIAAYVDKCGKQPVILRSNNYVSRLSGVGSEIRVDARTRALVGLYVEPQIGNRKDQQNN